MKELPSAVELSRETIQINTAFHDLGPTSPGNLSYELRPDNSLLIRRTKVPENSAKEVAIGQETLQLSPDAATDARRMLWRVRPETLQGIQYIIRPTVCPPPPVDASPELFVDFIAEGPKPGIADDRFGIFDLPTATNCQTSRATEARKMLHNVLQSFPYSNVASDFDREVTRWRQR